MLRRSSLVECVSVLHGTGFTKRRFFFIHQYVHPCLSKNPKYTFYTIKSSLTLAYQLKSFIIYSILTLPEIENKSRVTDRRSNKYVYILFIANNVLLGEPSSDNYAQSKIIRNPKSINKIAKPAKVTYSFKRLALVLVLCTLCCQFLWSVLF